MAVKCYKVPMREIFRWIEEGVITCPACGEEYELDGDCQCGVPNLLKERGMI